ncbi:hypothetical protein [Flavobacterium sp.]|jgi:hypothetical protein|uniref:hypothetical protein n=1 Tax=Flavobacterium sp. TaxID=239 RepID=UPI0037BE3270
MKKVFLSLAVIAALTVVSCKQSENAEAPAADTTAVDTTATEAPAADTTAVDTTAAAPAAAEAPAAAPAAPATK